MPGYSFSTIEPNQIGQVTKWDVPINDWLGLKFGNANVDTFGNAISRRVEDSIYDDGGTASVDILNQSFGIDSRLTFTEPMSIQRARLIHERKRSEIEYQSYFQSASHSWFSAKAAAGFGAAMVGSLAHPLDLGLTFMPFVGSEKAAAGVAKMGGGQIERLAARGLLTEEQIARAGIPMPRLSGALIDGAVNQLAMEVPIALQKRRDMADYDASDFAFNVIAGGAFGAGVKAVGLAFERAARAWMNLDPKIKDAAPLKALRELMTGEPARFEADFKLDESVIRAQVNERVRAANPFDEAAARAEYAGPKADIGSGEPIIRYESKTAQVGETFEDAGLTYKVTSVKDGEVTAVQAGSETFSQKYSPELEVIAQKEARGLQLTPDDQAKVEQLIDPETPNAHADYQRRVTQIENEFEIPKYMDEQRRLNLEDYVAQKQAEYEKRVKDEVDAETQKAIADIRRQSEPPLTPEQAGKYIVKTPNDDASIKLVEDEADDLIKSVLDSVDSVEDRARLEAEINGELERLGFKKVKESENLNPPEKGSNKKPLNIESVSRMDDEGRLVVDTAKVQSLISNKEIGSPAGRALLGFLLKEDARHPLARIEILDGGSSKDFGFQGRYRTRYGTNVGLIDIVAVNTKGERVSEDLFVRILNHELLHNAVTSKYDVADVKIKERARRVFLDYLESVKGTDLEAHNSTKNISEFFAEALSGNKVRKHLVSIDYSKKIPLIEGARDSYPDISPIRNTLFGELLRIVKDVLGISEKVKDPFSGVELDAITALDEVVHVADILMREKRAFTSPAYDMMPTKSEMESAINAMIPCVTAKAKL